MEKIKKQKILNALRYALKREIEAFNFYMRESQKQSYSDVNTLFLQLAEEERKHRQFLLKEIRKINNLLVGDSYETGKVSYTIPDTPEIKHIHSLPFVDLFALTLPSELLSGDYIESFIIDREQCCSALGIFLFDVMGHDLESSKIKAKMKSIVGELVEKRKNSDSIPDIMDTGKIMSELNTKIFKSCAESGRFITAFYGIFDFENQIFTYTSAGHDTPILIKNDGTYRHIEKTELLLGAVSDIYYSGSEIHFDTGDTFIMFSDGLSEAYNKKGKMFERQGIIEAVEQVHSGSAKEIMNKIFDSLRKHAQGEPLNDDFTLAVFKMLG
ncbi:MAG: SpoIIE family protein phosphatase [bacterium]